MNRFRRAPHRGFGMIVVLIVLVIVAFLAIKNWSSLKSTTALGTGTELQGQKPEAVLEHFKKEADKMGQLPAMPNIPTSEEN